jgi:hypothetical protein
MAAAASQINSLKGMFPNTCQPGVAAPGDQTSPGSRASVAAQQLDQIIDAFPMFAEMNRALNVPRTLLFQCFPC